MTKERQAWPKDWPTREYFKMLVRDVSVDVLYDFLCEQLSQFQKPDGRDNFSANKLSEADEEFLDNMEKHCDGLEEYLHFPLHKGYFKRLIELARGSESKPCPHAQEVADRFAKSLKRKKIFNRSGV